MEIRNDVAALGRDVNLDQLAKLISADAELLSDGQRLTAIIHLVGPMMDEIQSLRKSQSSKDSGSGAK